MERRQQILTWIKEAIAQCLPGISYKAFVFGSQANLPMLKRADIDIGIMADKPINTRQLAALHEAVDALPMLYKIDLVDFGLVDAAFKAVALQNIETL
jgi:DNA polymerase sigma